MKSVLIVEDFAPFRAVLSGLLQERTGFQVLSEASDGLEAVRRARELNPNLIFMDIGLPGISGNRGGPADSSAGSKVQNHIP